MKQIRMGPCLLFVSLAHFGDLASAGRSFRIFQRASKEEPLDGYYVVDGAPSVHPELHQEENCVDPESDSANIRCCDNGGRYCQSICNPEPADQTEAIAQYTKRSNANVQCNIRRMRLCTKEELDSNLCAGMKSDCKYGQTLVWTNSQCNIAAFAASKAAAEVSHRAISGCPSAAEAAEKYTSRKVKFGVRCCKQDGSACTSRPQRSPCETEMSYDEADQHCAGFGLRLCTEAEVKSEKTDSSDRLCCRVRGGCGLDNKLIWVNDNDALPVVQVTEAPEMEMKKIEEPKLEISNIEGPESEKIEMSGANALSGAQGGIFHLLQYRQRFCTGTYVALEFNSLGAMTQVNIPKSKSPIGQPEVICNQLDKNATDGKYTLHSCLGLPEGHCGANCNSCGEDYVKHFELSVCNKGWLLLKGPAPEDCTGEKKECTSLNQVDVGLARWCKSWP